MGDIKKKIIRKDKILIYILSILAKYEYKLLDKNNGLTISYIIYIFGMYFKKLHKVYLYPYHKLLLEYFCSVV